MNHLRRALGPLLLTLGTLGFSACQSPPAAPDALAFESIATRSGTFSVAWRAIPAEIPINEDFELEVQVLTPDGAAVTGAEVYVSGDMPAHGHGMLREPRAEELGAGLYRVRGMLLHMGGHWELSIDIIRDGVAESADFKLEL